MATNRTESDQFHHPQLDEGPENTSILKINKSILFDSKISDDVTMSEGAAAGFVSLSKLLKV